MACGSFSLDLTGSLRVSVITECAITTYITYEVVLTQDYPTPRCDDCPGFWHNYKEGWKSLVWNFKRMFGINVNLRRKINGGFVIYGPGGQRYELDYSQAKVGKGIIGVIDLSDPSNPYSALTYRTSTNVLDAMTGLATLWESDPLNDVINNNGKSDPIKVFQPSEEYPGYYEWFTAPDLWNHEYVYKRIKFRGRYVMKQTPKDSLNH